MTGDRHPASSVTYWEEFHRQLVDMLAQAGPLFAPPPEPSRRERAAARIGTAGWTTAAWIDHAGRRLARGLSRLADRVEHTGDRLAARVAGR